MDIYTTRTFETGEGEAVLLPKEAAFGPGTEVEIRAHGNEVTIRRKRKYMTNQELVARLREIGPPPDGVQEREPIEWPERPGL